MVQVSIYLWEGGHNVPKSMSILNNIMKKRIFSLLFLWEFLKFSQEHKRIDSQILDASRDPLWRHQIWDHFFMVKPLYIALISSKINIFRRNLDKKCIIFKTHWKFSRFFQFSRKFRFWIIFEPNSPPGNIFMPSNLMILLVLLHIYH